MADFTDASDAELNKISQEIASEQKRRKEIAALEQEAKLASEQILLVLDGLERYGAVNRFEFLRNLIPEEFIDWIALGGGAQKSVWKQPTDASNTYMAGDVVTYQGQSYRSLISQNSFSPIEDPSSWQTI